MTWNATLARRLILEKGFRRSFVAQHAGIGSVTLSKYLSTKQRPSKAVMILLAQILGCTAEELETIPKKQNAS